MVDLAKLPIGSDSLTGLLTRVLGWQQAPAFVTQLQRGEASLVLDSLDEAQLAAGRQHFAAFMKNVVELLRGGSKSRQVIICGRRDAIETAFLTLADLGEDVSQGSIASLTYPQSCNLINSVLDETHRDGKKYVIHRTHSGPFGKHRDRVLVDMARALGSSAEAVEDSWEVAGDFLGYPPVLLVLARHLVVDNPSAVSAPGYSHPNSSDRGGLLREVIEELLDRETEKVRGQIAAPLGLSSSDPKLRIVYTRDEQVLRLIRFLTHQEITIPLPSALSPDERVTYEEQIEGFVPDHPFLRGAEVENVVFSDYMDALVLTSPTIAVQGLKNNGSSLDAGPFFAHFVHAMAPRSEGMALPDLQEKYLDRVVKSFAAGSLVQGTFVYSDSEDRPGTLVLSEGAEDSDRARHASHLAFRIPDRSGVLELSSPVTRGVLVTSGAATVSSTTDEIVLGPDLTIVAQELHFDSQRINVSSAAHVSIPQDGGVWLFAVESLTHNHALRLSVHPNNALHVSSKNLSYQWQSYRYSMGDLGFGQFETKPEVSWQVMFGIRRLLTSFQSSAANDPSLYYERLERIAVGSNKVFAATLKGLIELGLVVHEGTLYRLRLALLAEYGVSWSAMRGTNFAANLKALHQEVCKTQDVRDLLIA